MGTHTHMEERLWDYIDGLCTPAERTDIDGLLSTDPAWKAAHASLLDTVRLMKATELEQPSLRFTKNVMESIAVMKVAPATRTYVNKNVIRGIAAFFLLVISGFLIYGISQVNFNTGEASSPLPKLDIPAAKYVPAVLGTLFLMADAILGLLFLDRYLSRRRNQAA